MATRSTKTATKTSKTAPKAATKTVPVALKTTTTTTTAKAVAKPAEATPAAAAKATVVESVKPVLSDAPIKKPELIDRVMAETGMKKKDVKPVVEAMLAVLGRALTNGEELTVPPLGKLMIKRTKEAANATIVTIKLRHPRNFGGAGNAPKKAPLADEMI